MIDYTTAPTCTDCGADAGQPCEPYCPATLGAKDTASTTGEDDPARPLTPGDLIQYRRVGKARLVALDSAHAPGGEGWWTVQFLTGPGRSYATKRQNKLFWVAPKDRLDEDGQR